MPLRLTGHKYNAKAVVIDGHRFPSMAEAKRYQELKLLEKAGEIAALELQPRFELFVENAHYPEKGTRTVTVGHYVGDFRYAARERGQVVMVVEDVKGVRTPLYRLKKKMAEAIHGIEVREL